MHRDLQALPLLRTLGQGLNSFHVTTNISRRQNIYEASSGDELQWVWEGKAARRRASSQDLSEKSSLQRCQAEGWWNMPSRTAAIGAWPLGGWLLGKRVRRPRKRMGMLEMELAYILIKTEDVVSFVIVSAGLRVASLRSL